MKKENHKPLASTTLRQQRVFTSEVGKMHGLSAYDAVGKVSRAAIVEYVVQFPARPTQQSRGKDRRLG